MKAAMLILFAGLAALSSVPVQADPLDGCCRRAASEKGHAGHAAACYVSVCKQYVAMQPDGRSCLAFGTTFQAYRAALQAECGIAR